MPPLPPQYPLALLLSLRAVALALLPTALLLTCAPPLPLPLPPPLLSLVMIHRVRQFYKLQILIQLYLNRDMTLMIPQFPNWEMMTYRKWKTRAR